MVNFKLSASIQLLLVNLAKHSTSNRSPSRIRGQQVTMIARSVNLWMLSPLTSPLLVILRSPTHPNCFKVLRRIISHIIFLAQYARPNLYQVLSKYRVCGDTIQALVNHSGGKLRYMKPRCVSKLLVNTCCCFIPGMIWALNACRPSVSDLDGWLILPSKIQDCIFDAALNLWISWAYYRRGEERTRMRR